MTGPISPADIGAEKSRVFPPFVWEAINSLIAANYTSGSARMEQDHQKDNRAIWAHSARNLRLRLSQCRGCRLPGERLERRM